MFPDTIEDNSHGAQCRCRFSSDKDEVSRISLGFPLDFLSGARSLVYGSMFETIDSQHRTPLLRAIANEQEQHSQAS